jgi:hypothetical protein
MGYVCGTVSGATVSNLKRGIDPLTGTTSSATLKYAHRVGATSRSRISPLPSKAAPAREWDRHDSQRALLRDLSISTIASSATGTIPHEVRREKATAGGADANETTRGCIELATALDAGSWRQPAGRARASCCLPRWQPIRRRVAPQMFLVGTSTAIIGIPVLSRQVRPSPLRAARPAPFSSRRPARDNDYGGSHANGRANSLSDDNRPYSAAS